MAEPPHLVAGRWAERAAERYLLDQGLQLWTRNFRCRGGEIDLVLLHDEVLVFAEVRLRSDDRFGGALASVTISKQRRLQRAARAFIARHGAGTVTCRFDVLSVSKRNYRPEIVWVQNAFGQDS